MHADRGSSRLTIRSRRGRVRSLLREARSWPTLLAVVLCLAVGIPLVVLLTPDQKLHILGQTVAVGARDPQLSLSGPAQIVQVGNTKLDLTNIQVYGPLRPRISLGPVQRNAAAEALTPTTSANARSDATRALFDGFVRWYLWGLVGVLAFAIAASALVGCLRMLVILGRESRAGPQPGATVLLWRRLSGAVSRMTLVVVAASLLAWTASGALAIVGTARGLANVSSLSELVGPTRVSPSPVGPPVYGYSGAVIGDSRVARVGGPPITDATTQDVACERSTDSLAAELALMQSSPILNLACSGASIAHGLRGPQQRGDVQVAPQVGLLKQVQELKFVIVAIGPNDLYWADFLRYCYGLASCDDKLAAGEFNYRMAAFDQDYAGLLQDLNDLPDQPEVIIMASYRPFAHNPGTGCPDLRGPAGTPGLNTHKIALLDERNARLNAVLEAGARKYGFAIAHPNLLPLCADTTDGLGPDLQGLGDDHPFHPTAVGSLRLAVSAAQVLAKTASPE